jgi:hypothetical protein
VPWPGAVQQGRGGPYAMNYIRHLNIFFKIAQQDKSLTSAHISLYVSLFLCWNYNRFINPFPINRETLLRLSKIGSKNTYHKCLKELHKAGYIFYHPAPSRFEAVKISIAQLDGKREQSGSIQLDIFSGSGDSQCPNNGTHKAETPVKNGTVPGPNLIPSSVKYDTVPVPHLGHSYKLNIKTINSVCNTPTKIFNKNQLLNEAISETIQDAPPPKTEPTVNTNPPTLSEVESFFLEYNFPGDEAQKFFLYNDGKAWMLTPQMKIKNWQSLARKWMLNTNGNNLNGNLNSQIKVNNDKDYGEPL